MNTKTKHKIWRIFLILILVTSLLSIILQWWLMGELAGLSLLIFVFVFLCFQFFINPKYIGEEDNAGEEEMKDNALTKDKEKTALFSQEKFVAVEDIHLAVEQILEDIGELLEEQDTPEEAEVADKAYGIVKKRFSAVLENKGEKK